MGVAGRPSSVMFRRSVAKRRRVSWAAAHSPLSRSTKKSRAPSTASLATRAKVPLRPALPFPHTLLSLPQLCQRPFNTFASALQSATKRVLFQILAIASVRPVSSRSTTVT